jgi:HPt (histidine-containing phosphotransfer) domain-containing protein
MHDSAAAVPATEHDSDTDGQCTTLAVLDQDVLDNLRDLPGEGADDLLGELIILFAQEAPPRISQLRTAILQSDATRVMQVAHSLKGSSANLGASCMAGLCNRLEQQGRQGNLDGALHVHDEIVREYRRVMLALDAERTRSA